MAAEAEASREARAKVIAAEGEQKASRQLKEAADVIAESPIALQLRYLQTLTQISAEKNSTIIFPVPSKYNFKLEFLFNFSLFSRIIEPCQTKSLNKRTFPYFILLSKLSKFFLYKYNKSPPVIL
jgi:carbohydrate-binding DOMON domain-containing protein